MTEDTTVEATTVFDQTAALWLAEYKAAKVVRDAADDRMAAAREHVERALGDNVIGLIDGQVAVTFKFVQSQRLDQAKAKALLTPEDLDAVTKTTVSRRFSVVEAS